MFDYKNALNGIKANLFDIYENQEQIIGLEENEKIRNQRLNKFIEIKDIALMLLEEIESLYINNINQENLNINKLNNPKIPQIEEESEILNLIQNNTKEKIDSSNDIEEDVSSDTDDESSNDVEEDVSGNTDDESSNDVEEDVSSDTEDDESFNDLEEDVSGNTEEDESSNDAEEDVSSDIENDGKSPTVDENISTDEKEGFDTKKYYLECEKDHVNFAYVPKKLFNKIKKNANLSLNNTNDVEESDNDIDFSNNEVDDKDMNNSRFEKIDMEKPKGIIVRSDQYMKLALSRHRQEGVVKEAKIFRINEVKKKQRENQKIELEKAKVNIDI